MVPVAQRHDAGISGTTATAIAAHRASEVTEYLNELAEMAMAHVIANKVEAAYRRGDMLERRRRLMEDWADFCAGASASAESQPAATKITEQSAAFPAPDEEILFRPTRFGIVVTLF